MSQLVRADVYALVDALGTLERQPLQWQAALTQLVGDLARESILVTREGKPNDYYYKTLQSIAATAIVAMQDYRNHEVGQHDDTERTSTFTH